MRLISLTSAAFLVVLAVAAVGQAEINDSDPVVVRLSYRSGRTMIDWRYQNGYPQTCLAVYQGGHYQISRLTEHGDQTLEGTMPKDQWGELQELLAKVSFQSQGGGIQYLQGAESFIVELVRHGETKRYFWVNLDQRNPLPKSAIKIVNWLQKFQARGTTPFKHYEESDIRICPSMNENPMPLTTEISNITCGQAGR
jgi:hypothetical protein